SDYRLDLGQGGIRGGGQPGVKSEIDGRIALRLREPLAYGLQRRAAAGLDSEVNVRGYPATCRRARAGCVIVAGDHAALKHSEMDVRVDATGQNDVPSRVERFVTIQRFVGDRRQTPAANAEIGHKRSGRQ